MSSRDEEHHNSNGDRQDSRLKSKKPPSLTIAIPPAEDDDAGLCREPTGEPPPDSSNLAQDRRAAFRRQTSLSQSIRRGTAQWFGVGSDCETKQQLWQRKSLRHCSQRYGKLKAQYREHDPSSVEQLDSPAATRMPKIVDPLARGRAFRQPSDSERPRTPHMAHPPHTPGITSVCSFSSQRSGYTRLPRRKRESVARMSIRAASNLLKGRPGLQGSHVGRNFARRSFARHSWLEDDTVDGDTSDSVFFSKGDVHDELSSMADDVFESPPLSATWTPGEMPFQEGAPYQSLKDVSKVPPQPERPLQRRGRRIASQVKHFAFDKHKRQYGMGVVGKWLNRHYRRSISSQVQKQLDDFHSHRFSSAGSRKSPADYNRHCSGQPLPRLPGSGRKQAC